MELIRPDINIDFVGVRYKAIAISAVLIVLGLAVLFWRGGLNMGVDFAGGTLIQVQFQKETKTADVRDALEELGVEDASIQQVGSVADNEFLIRTDAISSELQSLAKEFQQKLDGKFGEGQTTIRRVEMVGPKVGQDLRQKALFAVYYALLLLAIYISGRFEFKWGTSAIMAGGLVVGVYLLEALGVSPIYLIFAALAFTLVLCWLLKLPYALGAMLSLIHDVLIVIGFFALTNKELTLEVLAAILTLVGFSLNDTIVIYDRIRENLRKSRKSELVEVINTSINQTLGRTILTSGTVLLVVALLFFFGGTVIHDFAFAMLVGIIAGIYSTVYIASPILILYEDWRKGVPQKAQSRA